MAQWTVLGYITILALWCGSVDSTRLQYHYRCFVDKGEEIIQLITWSQKEGFWKMTEFENKFG